MEKTVTKFWDSEIKKQIFHQTKRPISIKIQILIKQQYLIRSISVKMDLNISLATNIFKKKQTFIHISFKKECFKRRDCETKYMPLLTKDAELLVQYNKNWEKNYKWYQKIIWQ